MRSSISFYSLILLIETATIMSYSSIAFQPRPRRFHFNSPFQTNRFVLFSSYTTSQERTDPCTNYVLVNRNKQSMAFRNGSPLIFSGSIHSTVSLNTNTAIPVGDLVGVMVLGKDYQDHPHLSKKTKKQEEHVRQFLVSSDSVQEWWGLTNTTWKNSKVPTEWFQQTMKQSTLIGFGVWNPFSMYRVRMLCHQSSHPTLFRQISSLESSEAVQCILETKIRQAMSVRQALRLPSLETNCYRLINGEGDGLSGLVVDVFPNVAVIMASSLWCEIYKERILETLQHILNHENVMYRQSDQTLRLIWRNTPSRLVQDGIDHVPELMLESNQRDEKDGYQSEGIIVTENGVRYYTYPWDVTSQKTGFYCDQRENRIDFAKLCYGKKVLDLCTFNGGFALNAVLLGNATHAVGVDSSPVAIEAARKNAQLNGIDSDQIQFLKEDITSFMKQALLNGTAFEVIALDPPKLAPSVGDLDRATRKYHALNRDAMKLIDREKGGILMTCTCSAAMTQKDGGQYFLQMIKEASLAAGRQITLLKTSGAAQCHTQCPASYPAGVYLTAAFVHVHPVS